MEVWPDLDLDLLAKNLKIIDLTKRGFRLVRSEGVIEEKNLDLLIKLIRKRAPEVKLIILETFHRMCGREDEDSVSLWVEACERLSSSCGQATVVTVHHTGKGEGRLGQYAQRGHSSFADDARSGILLVHGEGKDAEKALREVFGRDPTPEELRSLTVVKHVKPFRTALAKPYAVEPVVTKWGIALTLYDKAGVGGAVQGPLEKFCEVFRAVLESTNEPVTARTLRPLHKKVGVTRDGMDLLLLEAKQAGYVAVDPKVRRKGAETLMYGPKWPLSDAAEPKGPAGEQADGGDDAGVPF
jgi:hypothetical protein